MNDQIKGIDSLIKHQLQCAARDIERALNDSENELEFLRHIDNIKTHISVVESEIEYKNDAIKKIKK
jgi:hypothetical protein